MNRVENFLKQEICLNIDSKEEDVLKLSEIIKTDYPGYIVPQVGEWRSFSKNLLDYWNHAKEFGWELVFVNRQGNYFDAYKKQGAKTFKITHPMLTAEEILRGYVLEDIHEDEMMNLLEVEA